MSWLCIYWNGRIQLERDSLCETCSFPWITSKQSRCVPGLAPPWCALSHWLGTRLASEKCLCICEGKQKSGSRVRFRQIQPLKAAACVLKDLKPIVRKKCFVEVGASRRYVFNVPFSRWWKSPDSRNAGKETFQRHFQISLLPLPSDIAFLLQD